MYFLRAAPTFVPRYKFCGYKTSMFMCMTRAEGMQRLVTRPPAPPPHLEHGRSGKGAEHQAVLGDELEFHC